jgi:hypothetical protein
MNDVIRTSDEKVIDPIITLQGVILELDDLIASPAFGQLSDDDRDAIEDLRFRASEIEESIRK